MLYNSKQQVVTLTPAMIRVCAEGLQNLTDGKSNTNAIKTRRNILSPLRETKELSDPCGRSAYGMFNLCVRAKFID